MRQAVTPTVLRWVFSALGAVLVIAAVVDSKAQSPSSGDEGLVLAADQSLGNAMRAGDRSVARKILSLQFSFVDEDGRVLDRKDFLGSLKEVAAAPSSDAKVTLYGRIGMVTGHRKSVHDEDVFFIDIWAKQKGAWRALLAQDVVLATSDPATAGNRDQRLAAEDEFRDFGKFLDCHNPCETIPYRVRSPAEQDVVNVFQDIEKAIFARDAAEYSRHVADDFVHYESGYPPVPKSERMTALDDRKKQNTPAIMTAVQSMRLWVYDDGAAMISANGAPDQTDPLMRMARVWVKRNGEWQMAISVQTNVKNP